MLNAIFGEKNPIYRISDTINPSYIVLSHKDQIFYQQNPVSDLFCWV